MCLCVSVCVSLCLLGLGIMDHIGDEDSSAELQYTINILVFSFLPHVRSQALLVKMYRTNPMHWPHVNVLNKIRAQKTSETICTIHCSIHTYVYCTPVEYTPTYTPLEYTPTHTCKMYSHLQSTHLCHTPLEYTPVEYTLMYTSVEYSLMYTPMSYLKAHDQTCLRCIC